MLRIFFRDDPEKSLFGFRFALDVERSKFLVLSQSWGWNSRRSAA